eukprot:3136702-Lingulodinium_polyedra.AAC.1
MHPGLSNTTTNKENRSNQTQNQSGRIELANAWPIHDQLMANPWPMREQFRNNSRTCNGH